MLQNAIASKYVEVGRSEIPVQEDFVGEYTVPVLELTIGTERVRFQPKGINVIGASGRVDIRGDRDTVTLFRNEPQEDGEWMVVLQRVPQLRTVPLDEESLREVLDRVMLPLP